MRAEYQGFVSLSSLVYVWARERGEHGGEKKRWRWRRCWEDGEGAASFPLSACICCNMCTSLLNPAAGAHQRTPGIPTEHRCVSSTADFNVPSISFLFFFKPSHSLGEEKTMSHVISILMHQLCISSTGHASAAQVCTQPFWYLY